MTAPLRRRCAHAAMPAVPTPRMLPLDQALAVADSTYVCPGDGMRVWLRPARLGSFFVQVLPAGNEPNGQCAFSRYRWARALAQGEAGDGEAWRNE